MKLSEKIDQLFASGKGPLFWDGSRVEGGWSLFCKACQGSKVGFVTYQDYDKTLAKALTKRTHIQVILAHTRTKDHKQNLVLWKLAQ